MKIGKRIISLVLALVVVCSLTGSLFIPTSAATLPFTDISNSPYYDSIEFVYNEGIMRGITTTTFEPNTQVTRAMFVTVLYRMSGDTGSYSPTQFDDVEAGRYYYSAVGWAEENDIVNGITDTTFEPDRIVTVQQALTFLWRFANYQGILISPLFPTIAQDTMGTNYSNVHKYSRDAVNWAMNVGILSSKITTIEPDKYTVGTENEAAKVSRGLCAYYLHRYMALVYSDSKAFDTPVSEYRSITDAAAVQLKNGAVYFAAGITIDEMVHVKNAMKYTNILYLATDGDGDGIYLNSGKTEYWSEVGYNAAGGAELVFLSGSRTGGDFADALAFTGLADAVIGYTGDLGVYNSDSSKGANYFDLRVLAYINREYSAEEAVEATLDDMRELSIAFEGVETAYVY